MTKAKRTGMPERSDRPRGVPTLKEVARLASVSISTASRALSGARRVDPGLVERVQEAASALRYRPDFRGRSLRSSKTMTLGIVYHNLDNPGQLDILSGVGSAGDERGYSLLVTNARGSDELYKTLMQRLFERRVDGLILTSPGAVSEFLELYEAAGIPVLALYTRDPSTPDLPIVTASEARAITASAVRLVELGHRSFGYLGTEASLRSDRYVRTRKALERALGSPVDFAVHTIPEDMEHDTVRRIVRELVQARGVAALYCDHRNVPQVLSVLGEMELRLARDVSMISFSESRWAHGFAPHIATIKIDVEGLGRSLAEVLIDWIDGTPPPRVTSAQEAQWLERVSLAPPGL